MTNPNPPPEEEDRTAEQNRELAETIKQETGAVSETVKDEAGGLDENAKQRAEELAQKVEDEAAAVTERVEQRAEALEGQRAGQAEALEQRRVEQRATERTESRSDIKSELSDITVAIGQLIQHMDQSLPEDRVTQLVEATLAEERRSRFRLIASLMTPIIIVLILGVVQLNQGADIKNLARQSKVASQDSKVVADYVRNCILTRSPDPEQCGPQASSQAGFVQYLNCAFLIIPEERTDAKLNACASEAFGG